MERLAGEDYHCSAFLLAIFFENSIDPQVFLCLYRHSGGYQQQEKDKQAWKCSFYLHCDIMLMFK